MKNLKNEGAVVHFSQKEYVLRIIIKAIAIISSVYGMLVNADGLDSLTYFTYLSNIMISIILGVFLIYDIQILRSSGAVNPKTNISYIIKYMFTISITLTLLVFFFFLAPTYDSYFDAYFSHYGASFCTHLLPPVLAIIDFIAFDYEFKSNKKHVLYAIIPPLCYVAFVIFLGQCFSYRWDGKMAPYNFINYGAPAGWFGFDLASISGETMGIGVFYMIIVLIIIFIGIGLLFLHLKDLRRKSVR